MATQNELMAEGIPAGPARGLGMTAIDTATAPAGSSQTDAALLKSTMTAYATTGSGTGFLLPAAGNKPIYSVYNGDGSNALLVYPNGSATINGGASFSIAAHKTAIFIADGLNWLALVSA